MKKENAHPPRWAERFLEWYCRPEILEDLQGDLHEYFERNLQSKSLFRARLIYCIDVFKFIRLYTVRKPAFLNLFIHWIMISSYIKSSGRNLLRSKLFSFINIFGLAVSMAVGLMLISILSDITTFDKFHKNYEDIYRVISLYEYKGVKDRTHMATTSLKAGRAMEENFTGVEAVAVLRREFSGDVTFEEKALPFSGFWANPGFFKVFSFNLLRGNATTALKEPFSMVLTQRSALKLFGTEDVLGKTVTLNHDRQYTITGILEDVPYFSHFKFDMLGSISTRTIVAPQTADDERWDNIWNSWVYAYIPNSQNLPQVQTSLEKLSQREDPTVANTRIHLSLQPLNDVMLGSNLSNQIGPELGSTLLMVFLALTGVVLLSAFFNYNNLSIARSLRRGREVGIRKVIGAQRTHVITQFIVEAVLLSLCALVLAFVLFFILRPHFLSLEKGLQELFTLQISVSLVIYFVLFAVGVGIVAGFFPALFYSKIQSLKVLKGTVGSGTSKSFGTRKTLIVIQYAISIILICASIGIYRQYKHFVSYDLGYNTKNVLNIHLQGNKAEILKKELMELPEVQAISQSAMITSVGTFWGSQLINPQQPEDSIGVGVNYIDEHYLPLHGHTFLAGKNFDYQMDSAAGNQVIIDEEVLARLNISNRDAQRAIGEIIKDGDQEVRIIGVLKNFRYGRANERMRNPGAIFRYQPQHFEWLNVKLESDNLLETYARVESIWKKVDDVHPLRAHFYDQQIDEAFSGLRATLNLAGFLAFLAICIASLGLLGMVVFTTEIRVKEVSIRKVLGASESALLFLLGKAFFILLLIAAIIGLSITIIFFEQVVFPNVANSAPLNLGEMLMGVLVIFLIALVMIVSQTMKVTRTNPAEVLKSE